MFTVISNGVESPINFIQSCTTNFEVNALPEIQLRTVNRENNPGYHLLKEDELLVSPDGHKWRVFSVNERTHYKTVRAVHQVSDLINSAPFNYELNGTYTPRQVFEAILVGTGYHFDFNDGEFSAIELKEFGKSNRWSLFKDFCELIQAEFTILPNQTFLIRKQLGGDNGEQFRYGHNLNNVEKIVDSSKVVTHVIVNYGEEYEFTQTFVSPTASNYNRAIYGEIINDARIRDMNTARKRAEKAFSDVKISYELTAAELVKTYALGETVHTIYEPFNDLSIVTRILKTKYEWDNQLEEFILNGVVVGNYVFKDDTEVVLDTVAEKEEKQEEKLKEAKSEYRSEFIKTDNRISMEVERLDVSIAQVDIKADSINLRVTNLQDYTESSITLLQDQINLKVSKDGVISSINMSPETISITANKINLNGAVMVNGGIYGATTISVTQNISIGRTIYFSDMTNITSGGGNIWIDAWNDITYQAQRHTFYGTVDLRFANVLGLPTPASP